MPATPMEWTRFVLSIFGRTSLIAWVTLFISAGVSSAVLRLNPDDDSNNVITFDGALEATVVQSAAGMDIVIPGVKFTLNCQGDPTDSCTVSVESAPASPAPSAPASDSTPPQDPTPPNNDSSPSNDETCDDNSTFGGDRCGDTDQTGSSPPPTDSSADESSKDDSDSGFEVPGSGGQDDDTDNLDGWAINPPDTSADVSGTLSRDTFPESNRIAYQSTPDLGSGGAQGTGNATLISLGLKTVAVMPFSMSEKTQGGVVFTPSVAPPNSATLALWISASQDGAPVSGGCSYRGRLEGKLDISSASGGCQLQPETTYYLNAAACYGGDSRCRGAETGYSSGGLYVIGNW